MATPRDPALEMVRRMSNFGSLEGSTLKVRGSIRRGAHAVRIRGLLRGPVQQIWRLRAVGAYAFPQKLDLPLQKELGQCSHVQNWDWFCNRLSSFNALLHRLHVSPPTGALTARHTSSPKRQSSQRLQRQTISSSNT